MTHFKKGLILYITIYFMVTMIFIAYSASKILIAIEDYKHSTIQMQEEKKAK